MIRRSPMFRAAVVAFGLAVACSDTGTDRTDGAAPGAADDGTDVGSFASALTVDQIAVYQAVKVSLVSGGQPTVPNAPVIPKRPALVRVHAKVPPRVKVPKLTAELRVRRPGQPDVVLVNESRTIASFREEELLSSFYWELEAEQVATDATLSVEIRDPSGGDPTVLRYPAQGELPMNVGAFNPTLKVKFVPIRYEADGSNRIPVMDAGTIEGYRDALYKLYPVTNVEISVRDVLDWPLEVRGDGQGWGHLLDAVMETREDDKAPNDVYYVGVFNPAPTEREYCQSGSCILGIAPASILDSVSFRTAMIVGYHSERQHGTLAQELAHAMGRLHAPCGGPTNIDSKYPYADGSIGTWGWDVLEKTLVDPEEHVDFMSYCNPVWVSDYTFRAIHDRMVAVEQETVPADGPAAAPEAMRVYHVGTDGSLSAGPKHPLRTQGRPSGEVVLEDVSGQRGRAIRGSFQPFSNIGGGLLVTPDELPADVLRRTRLRRSVAAR